MPIQIQGNSGTVAEVDSVHRALRVASYPQNVGTRGAYMRSFYTGVLAAGITGNSEIFQFRWVPSTSTWMALIRSIRVSAAVSTTAFAAGVPITLEGVQARSWSAVGTGGTGITWATNDGKRRTDFAKTALTDNDVRIATTTGLGAGTKTLDGATFGTVCGQVGTAITTIIPSTILWQRDSSDEWPMLFENQEGFIIRVVEAPATGTWKIAVSLEWSEIDPSAVAGWS